jgi:hypothetical protein
MPVNISAVRHEVNEEEPEGVIWAAFSQYPELRRAAKG